MTNQNLESKEDHVVLSNDSLKELWIAWKKIPYSKLISIDQRFSNNVIVEFAININERKSFTFLEEISKLVIEKSPSGTISWVGYYSQIVQTDRDGLKNVLSTQFKKYRLEFFDMYNKPEEITEPEERIKMFFTKLNEFIKTYSKR